MIKRYIFLLMLFFTGSIWAQQDVQFTQYMNNRLYYNAGVAGTGGAICITGLHRSQWVGFEGAPTTQNITANIPIQALRGGIGLSIVNEQIGYFSNVSARLGYAYQLQLAQGSLGIGVGAGFLNRSLNNAQWIPSGVDPASGTPGTSDPALAGANASGFQIDLDFGLYYQSDRIWAGVSSSRMLESSLQVDNFPTGDKTAFFRNSRHYFVMGGYNWAIPGSNWELRPSALVKLSQGGPPTYEVNASGVYNKQIWGGVTYRLEDAVAAMVGYQFTPSFRAGYSYDVATAQLSGSAGGSHELMVQYCFKIEIPPRIPGRYNNVRFL